MPAIDLYPYQRRWMQAKSRFKICNFSRQCGKTFVTGLEIVDNVIASEVAGAKTHWVILSRGERQAREAMQKSIKLHAQAYSLGIEDLEYDYKGEDGTYKALEVVTPGGSRITALPANPDTARGFSANVFLDEFAHHKDSREIWLALFPVISAGFDLRVSSTPNGVGNKYYDLMTGDDTRWYRQTTDIYQAVADGLPRDIDELRDGMNDDDGWAQEYECKFLDEANAWLPYTLISANEHEDAGIPALYDGNAVYIGVDIAARNDLWVAWVMELVGDVLWTREIITLRRASFMEQEEVLADLFRRYNVVRCVMDQTGMGEKPVEDAKRRYGSTRVIGVLFNTSTKQVLATDGKQAFEDRQLRIPQGDSALRADLHKIKRVISEDMTTRPRFIADRDAAGHADRAWSCFMAVYGARSTGIELYDYYRPGDYGRGTRRRRHDDDRRGLGYGRSGIRNHRGGF